MAFALSTSASTARAPMRLFYSVSSHSHRRLSAGDLKLPGLIPPRHSSSFSRSTLTFSRRRNHDPAIISSSSKKKNMKKKSLRRENGDGDEDDMEDDPFEALISMLEEDLENDTSTVDEETDDEELNEEDVDNIDKLARELEEVLGDMELSNSAADSMKSGEEEAAAAAADDDDGGEDDKIKNKKKITILCFD